MDVDEALEAIKQVLKPERLGAIEQMVFRQSWLGRTYREIAASSGYNSDYIKEIGFRLWQDLSEALGTPVTKKNLYINLNHYFRKLSSNRTYGQSVLGKQLDEQFPGLVGVGNIGIPGSPLSFHSPLYIRRPPLEELAEAELSQPGCVLRIRAPRRMGKSSLLNQLTAYAQNQGYQTVSLDLQEADGPTLNSLNLFLRWFCCNISSQMGLPLKLDQFWDQEIGSKVSCKIYFQNYLLQHLDTPLVLSLNQVDRLFEYPTIAVDFLSMLRFWHEQAQQDFRWQKLRLVLAHSTEVYVPFKLNQSPFNVGKAIALPPFTLEQMQELAQRYGLPWEGKAGTQLVLSLQKLVNGHPYLTNLAFYHLCRGEMTVEDLLHSAAKPTGIYSHHLRGLLAILKDEPQLAFNLQQVMAIENGELDAIAAYKLESLGLISLQGTWAKPSCELYRTYFSEQLAAIS